MAMKKILLGTTALVAATAITAGVAKADMSVTGWNTFGLGFGNVETSAKGLDGKPLPSAATGQLDVYENGEIYFSGSTELDNGMTIGWDVQLETENGNGNFIDENYFTIGGDFGTVIIGQENLPNYKMHYSGGMWVGNAGISSASYTQFSGSPGGISYFHFGFMNDTAPVGNDADMVSYYTPRMGGFQVGLGWMPDSDQNDKGHKDATTAQVPTFSYANTGPTDIVDGDLQNGNLRANLNAKSVTVYGNDGAIEFEDVFSLGVNYKADMGGTSIAASAGYTSADVNLRGQSIDFTESTEVETFQLGLNVAKGGMTLGASYMEQTDSDHVRTGETENFLLGVKYATGPHTIGLTGIWSEAEHAVGNQTFDAVTNIAEDNGVEGTAYMLAHDYALGGGVSLTSSVTYLSIEARKDSVVTEHTGTVAIVMLNAGF